MSFDTGVASLVGIKSGMIVMWSGTIASIPAGWTLCNGSNGTPDLRDRFIVGAGSGYAVGATGGSSVHTLTQSGIGTGWPGTGVSKIDGADTGNISRLPPYYALAFIMKI